MDRKSEDRLHYCPNCGIELEVISDYDIIDCPCCGKDYFVFELLTDSVAAKEKCIEAQYATSNESERMSAFVAGESRDRRQKADKHEKIKFLKGLVFWAVVVTVCVFIFSRCSTRNENADNKPLDRYLKTSGFSKIEMDVISVVLNSEVISCEDLLGYTGENLVTPKEGVTYEDCFKEAVFCELSVGEDAIADCYLLSVVTEDKLGNDALIEFHVYKNSDTWSLYKVLVNARDVHAASVDPEYYGDGDYITQQGFPEDYRYVGLNQLVLNVLYAMAPSMFYYG